MSPTGDLDRRVENWFRAVIDASAARPGLRTRSAAAGPLEVRHTFEPGSSHEFLLDALVGDMGRVISGAISIHSWEAPPASLMLPSPVTDDDLAGRIAPRSLQSTRWRLTWDGFAGVVRCFDVATGTGVFITAGPVEDWEHGAPLRSFLHWAASARGAGLVHAGTIGTSNGVGLVVGPGGTGKSTTVLVGLREGLATCGDDYVWLARTPAGLDVWAIYGTVKTKRGSEWAPGDAVRTQEVDGGAKRVHWLADASPSSFLTRAPLRAVVGLVPPAARMGRSDLLAAVSPSTAFQLPYDMAHTMSLLGSAVRDVPLLLVPRTGDLGEVARALRDAFGEPGRDGAARALSGTHV
ncbi:MAG: hypothetical protein RLZ55_1653 [Actinomycetota bacterium]|jgi:hypothetical protein